MKIYFIIFYIFILSEVHSQTCSDIPNGKLELVRNGSFEEYTQKAFDQSQIQFAKHWLQVPNINSTADYRHKDFTCPAPQPNLLSCIQRAKLESNGDYSIEGLENNQQPKEGRGFAMIQAILPSTSTSNTCTAQSLPGEYLMQELAQPLLTGRTYFVKMHVNLADAANFAAKGLSIFFTKEIPKNNSTSPNCPLTINPPAKVVKDEFVTDKINWTEISGSFVAEGGEKFMTIGVLDPSPSKVSNLGLSPNNSWGSAYYLIDDVSVTFDLCNQPDFNTSSEILVQTCGSCVPKPNPPRSEFPNAIIQTTSPWAVKIFNGTSYLIRAFNRWGQRVYEDTGFDPCGFDSKIVFWDGLVKNGVFGTVNGSIVPSDTYVYHLDISNCNSTKRFTGEIVVIGPGSSTSPIIDEYICSCPTSIRGFFPSGLVTNCASAELVTHQNITTPVVKNTSIIVQSDNTTINTTSGITEFNAGYQIELNDNFIVSGGSTFKASITGCNISSTGLIRSNTQNSEQAHLRLSDKAVTDIIDLDSKELNQNIGNFTIYPNPADNTIFLNYNVENETDISITLHDFTGKKIRDIERNKHSTKSVIQKNIDLNALKPGQYFFNLQTGSENRVLRFTKIN